jgi:hypothetical protein
VPLVKIRFPDQFRTLIKTDQYEKNLPARFMHCHFTSSVCQ